MIPPDDAHETRLPSGLIVPPSAQTVMEQRLEASLNEEVANLVAWAQSFERDGQPKLTITDIKQAAVTRSQAFLWPPSFFIQVAKRAIQALELDVPHAPQKETRQQRRHRERRTDLRALPDTPVADPTGDGRGDPYV
jgi:hypothetical protein